MYSISLFECYFLKNYSINRNIFIERQNLLLTKFLHKTSRGRQDNKTTKKCTRRTEVGKTIKLQINDVAYRGNTQKKNHASRVSKH